MQQLKVAEKQRVDTPAALYSSEPASVSQTDQEECNKQDMRLTLV